jgi:glycosyltransferase involved in cell wall biosynthesis
MERERARSTLGVSYGGFLVGWMARMTEVKNPFLLLQVAARLPDIRFVMAGGGNLFEDIKGNAPKNVAVIGWSDAAIFWSAVDCAISTSDNEGVPIALIEAQLAGIPVIATNVGSNGEIVLDGETGFLVRKNASELIDSVQKLEKSAILLRSMGDLARNRTSKKFSLSTMIAEHIKIYSQL